MANHVHWSINFDSINDAAKEKLKEILGREIDPLVAVYVILIQLTLARTT